MADEPDLVAMTIEVVANYVAHNTIAPDDVPGFIAKTHAAIKGLNVQEPAADEAADSPPPEHVPAVTVRKSLASREHIVSLIDGKPYKMLKRHLAGHGLTPAQYRERYNLKSDYPMTAPAYSEQRRATAVTIGLGQLGKARREAAKAAAAPPEIPTPSPSPAPTQAAPAKTRAARAAAAPATPETAAKPAKARASKASSPTPNARAKATRAATEAAPVKARR